MKNPALTAWMVSPTGLATRLRSVRDGADLSGSALAAAAGAGWSKTKVSKIENGKQLPSTADVRAWAAACEAEDEIDELLELLAEAHSVCLSWSARLAAGGQAANQAVFNEFVTTATLIQLWDNAIIPGILQTPAYARAILTESVRFHGPSEDTADIERAVARRMERASLLYEGGRDIQIITTEAALRHQVTAEPGDMVAQCDRLRTALDLPGLQFGIVPLHRQLTHFPRPSFELYDDLVLVTLPSGLSSFDDLETVAMYRRLFAQTWEDAATGSDAIAIITDAAMSYAA